VDNVILRVVPFNFVKVVDIPICEVVKSLRPTVAGHYSSNRQFVVVNERIRAFIQQKIREK
jgi:hypothetical protein